MVRGGRMLSPHLVWGRRACVLRVGAALGVMLGILPTVAQAQQPAVPRAPFVAADSLSALAARLDSIVRADSVLRADSARRDSLARDLRRPVGGTARHPLLSDAALLDSMGTTVSSDGALGEGTASDSATASGAVARWVLPPEADNPLAGIPRTHWDSVASASTRAAAARDRRLRVVISLSDRRLWTVRGTDTLLSAPVAIGAETVLDFRGRSWAFATPRGMRRVLDKTVHPAWIPPEWHYAEVAREYGLKLERLERERARWLSDGRRLEVRDSTVGIVSGIDDYVPLRTDEEIVFDSTIFVPPVGTVNRKIPGELGNYALDLGDGYLLHGTPHKDSIGRARTHGCIRLGDDDVAWLYEHVPVGTPVYIY